MRSLLVFFMVLSTQAQASFDNIEVFSTLEELHEKHLWESFKNVTNHVNIVAELRAKNNGTKNHCAHLYIKNELSRIAQLQAPSQEVLKQKQVFALIKEKGFYFSRHLIPLMKKIENKCRDEDEIGNYLKDQLKKLI